MQQHEAAQKGAVQGQELAGREGFGEQDGGGVQLDFAGLGGGAINLAEQMNGDILDIQTAFTQEGAAAAGEEVGEMGGGVGDGPGGGAPVLGDGLMQLAAEFGIARDGLMRLQQIADELVFGGGEPLVVVGNDALQGGREGFPFGGGIGATALRQAGGNLETAGEHDAAGGNAGHHRGAEKGGDRFR